MKDKDPYDPEVDDVHLEGDEAREPEAVREPETVRERNAASDLDNLNTDLAALLKIPTARPQKEVEPQKKVEPKIAVEPQKDMQIDIAAGAGSRRECLREALLQAAREPLPGSRDGPKKLLGGQKPGCKKRKRETNPTADITLGTIKCETYSQKSYIRVQNGASWKLLVNLEAKACADHKAAMKQVFETAVQLDQDVVAMKAHRDELVQAANGQARADVHADKDGSVESL